MDNKQTVAAIANISSVEPSTVELFFSKLSEVLCDECSHENKVAIPGFGTFEGVKFDERITTNLSSGKQMLLPPSIELRFKVGGVLKRSVKGGTK